MLKKYMKINFFISLALGNIGGLLLLIIGWTHNSQGEFYSIETGNINISYSAIILFSWIAFITIVCMCIGLLVFGCFRLVKYFAKSN